LHSQAKDIVAKDFIIERLTKEFKGRESFSRVELFDFYRQFEPDVKEATFRWRIYHLKDKKSLLQLKRDFLHFHSNPFSSQKLVKLK
jgi:hypothetical protein